MNDQLSESYVHALRKTWNNVTESADFVMYWWAKAADLTAFYRVRRFGFVTTNSITMAFNRSVIADRLESKQPISLVYAIPDHPWIEGDAAASVRIAMTVGAAGNFAGSVQKVENRRHGQTGSDLLGSPTTGKITPFLTTGAMISAAKPLQSNTGLSFMGVIPVSLRFVLSAAESALIGQSDSTVLRQYLSGKDLTDHRPTRQIIDFFGLSETEARQRHPVLFQHILEHVKPFRDTVARANHRLNWWIFGEARPGMRKALAALPRFIATTETSKHRWFTFLGPEILPDQKIRVIASAEAWLLAMLSSRSHVHWATSIGGRVGKGNDPVYNNTLCFDPFPFPDPTNAVRTTLRDLGEELDTTRKIVQVEHPDLTLTGLYNVLEKVRAGAPLDAKDEDIKDRGRVLILKDLHDQIDRATADAYGWPHDLGDEQILERLVTLNAERAAEEAAGHVRWLRPDYQIPRFGKDMAAPKSGELDLGDNVVAIGSKPDAVLPAFPKVETERTLAILSMLETSGRPMDAAAVARAFKGGGRKIEQRVIQSLNTLVRYGWITVLPNGTFVARRAA